VRQAIEEGWTTAELRREINAGYAFSSSRALNITRTVSSQPRALEPGRREVQPEGSVKGRLTAGDDPVCDICTDTEAMGVIDLGEHFGGAGDAPVLSYLGHLPPDLGHFLKTLTGKGRP
jgi:hypothetical protein